MAEFMFLFRGGLTDGAPDNLIDDHEAAWDQWMEELEDRGVIIDGLPMKPMGVELTAEGVTDVDHRIVEDGIHGYLIIECSDMDEATEIASACPIFDFDGKVEVRALINERG
ncbi:MAG: hypothetical protein Kow0075_13670 [Salibacteraceae bacterium]